MRVNITISATVLAIIESSFLNKEGEQQKFYKANIMQDSGRSIAELRISKEIASLLEQGKEYTLSAEYSETKFGNALKITGVQGTNNAGKEM